MSFAQYSCGGDTVCCALDQCDPTAVTNFVNSHKTCTVDQDCKALCELGATCDDRGVNAAGAASFAATFSSCRFDQCAIACLGAHCNMGACSP